MRAEERLGNFGRERANVHGRLLYYRLSSYSHCSGVGKERVELSLRRPERRVVPFHYFPCNDDYNRGAPDRN